MKENIGQDLLEVKAAFDEWRAQRSSHKERIPQQLWGKWIQDGVRKSR